MSTHSPSLGDTSILAARRLVCPATVPIGAISNQIGTIVKLTRVLLLRSLVLALSVAVGVCAMETGRRRIHRAIAQFVPYFISAFVVMAGLRSSGILPQSLLMRLATASKWLATLSMAALGLGVDLLTLIAIVGIGWLSIAHQIQRIRPGGAAPA